MIDDREKHIATCCGKEIDVDEAVLNHGMCNEHMDEGGSLGDIKFMHVIDIARNEPNTFYGYRVKIEGKEAYIVGWIDNGRIETVTYEVDQVEKYLKDGAWILA